VVAPKRLGDTQNAIRSAWSFVSAAIPPLKPTEKANGSAATLTVTTVQPSGRGPVYDLTIDGVPEFFANGILVHNCGRFFEARPHSPRVPPPDPLAHLDDDPISKAHQQMLAKRESPAPKVFDISGLVK
jgi:hypothetical protein